MSATPISSSAPRFISKPSTATTALPNWLREPLLHFVVLGGLLFGADHLMFARTDDPRSVVVPAQVDADAKKLFTESRGRAPNTEELRALRLRWLDNEVLYREGLALRVDQGDPTIRERVIFKSLMAIEAGLKLPAIDDQKLLKWFESQRAQYDEPARYDFQEAVLTGDNSEAAVRAFAAALNAGAPGDAKAGLRVFKGRPRDNLVQGYGPEFAQALETAPVGEWHAQSTRDGWRAMRLDAITPPKPASFESLRGVVLQDWTDATMAQLRTDAVRELSKKYTIRVEGEKR
jgi:hypothetical protein